MCLMLYSSLCKFMGSIRFENLHVNLSLAICPTNMCSTIQHSFRLQVDHATRKVLNLDGVCLCVIDMRVRFLVWSAAWNKILTCDNLIKRGIYTMTSWCCMCKCNGETADLLLIHCHVASFLWCWILSAFGISWVFSGSVADLLFSWWNGLGRHASDVWNLIPLCLMWIV